jgi:hypothetical protein
MGGGGGDCSVGWGGESSMTKERVWFYLVVWVSTKSTYFEYNSKEVMLTM